MPWKTPTRLLPCQIYLKNIFGGWKVFDGPLDVVLSVELNNMASYQILIAQIARLSRDGPWAGTPLAGIER